MKSKHFKAEYVLTIAGIIVLTLIGALAVCYSLDSGDRLLATGLGMFAGITMYGISDLLEHVSTLRKARVAIPVKSSEAS